MKVSSSLKMLTTTTSTVLTYLCALTLCSSSTISTTEAATTVSSPVAVVRRNLRGMLHSTIDAIVDVVDEESRRLLVLTTSDDTTSRRNTNAKIEIISRSSIAPSYGNDNNEWIQFSIDLDDDMDFESNNIQIQTKCIQQFQETINIIENYDGSGIYTLYLNHETEELNTAESSWLHHTSGRCRTFIIYHEPNNQNENDNDNDLEDSTVDVNDTYNILAETNHYDIYGIKLNEVESSSSTTTTTTTTETKL